MYSLRVFLTDTEQFVADQEFESLEDASTYFRDQIKNNFLGFTVENPSGCPGIFFCPWYRIKSIVVIETNRGGTGETP